MNRSDLPHNLQHEHDENMVGSLQVGHVLGRRFCAKWQELQKRTAEYRMTNKERRRRGACKLGFMALKEDVTPAQAGVQETLRILDSRLRGNDSKD